MLRCVRRAHFFGATAFNMSLSKQFVKVMETALCAVEKELHHSHFFFFFFLVIQIIHSVAK